MEYSTSFFPILEVQTQWALSSNAYKAIKGSLLNAHVRFWSWVGFVNWGLFFAIDQEQMINFDVILWKSRGSNMCARMTRLDHLYAVVTMGWVKSPRAILCFINLLLAGIMDKIWTSLWILSLDHAKFVKRKKRYKFVPSLASVLWEDSDIGVWVILKYHWNLDTCHH